MGGTMHANAITINTETYLLAPTQDVEALKSAVVAAVRSGGDIVPIAPAGALAVDFLITATTAVKFSTVSYTRDDDQDVTGGQLQDWLDFDEFPIS